MANAWLVSGTPCACRLLAGVAVAGDGLEVLADLEHHPVAGFGAEPVVRPVGVFAALEQGDGRVLPLPGRLARGQLRTAPRSVVGAAPPAVPARTATSTGGHRVEVLA